MQVQRVSIACSTSDVVLWSRSAVSRTAASLASHGNDATEFMSALAEKISSVELGPPASAIQRAARLFTGVEGDDIDCFGTLGEYIVYALSGRVDGVVLMEPTVAAGLGLFDTASQSWRREVVAACGIPSAALPKIVAWDTVGGTIKVRARMLMSACSRAAAAAGAVRVGVLAVFPFPASRRVLAPPVA
jgi:sugar (pentulose or hexulose) kinase